MSAKRTRKPGDQRRWSKGANAYAATWQRSLRVAIARGSSATGIITNCWAFSFGFWLSHKRTCYQLVAEPAFIWLRLQPKEGKGTDLCAEIVDIARQRNPPCEFAVAFPDKEDFSGKPSSRARSSIISCLTTSGTRWMCSRRCVISDRFAWRHTRLLVETYNHLWEPFVTFAEWIGMKVPRTEQNWLSTLDIANLLKLAGFEALETHRIVILPKYVPLVSAFLNRFCARLPLLKRLCMTQIVVAKLLPDAGPQRRAFRFGHCSL